MPYITIHNVVIAYHSIKRCYASDSFSVKWDSGLGLVLRLASVVSVMVFLCSSATISAPDRGRSSIPVAINRTVSDVMVRFNLMSGDVLSGFSGARLTHWKV